MADNRNFLRQSLSIDNVEDIKKMLTIEQQKDVGKLIDKIRDCVKNELSGIKANQLRNIYDEAIKLKTEKELQLFRPKLAYITGRMRETESFVDFIDKLITSIKTIKAVTIDKEEIQLNESEVIENLHTVLESIVSYHKYYYGDK